MRKIMMMMKMVTLRKIMMMRRTNMMKMTMKRSQKALSLRRRESDLTYSMINPLSYISLKDGGQGKISA